MLLPSYRALQAAAELAEAGVGNDGERRALLEVEAGVRRALLRQGEPREEGENEQFPVEGE